MPIYESEETTRDKLEEIRKRNVCAVCGANLNMYLGENGNAFVACWDWLRTQHEGIMREPSGYERGGVEEFTIEKRREIIMEEHGAEKTRALSRYMGPGVVMTKSTATEIVETLWGDAPVIEKTKCILLCQTYQLNPLAKHIHLIGYKRGDGHGGYVKDAQGKFIKDWSLQQGIGATRLLAHRKHNYSYLDLTPRRATKAEIEKVFGDEADPNSLYAFVHIKDVDTGAEVTALRGIPKNYKLKGVEKGNTLLNQVCIWSERLALDRQYPGEMPPGVEVVDERYEDVPDVGKVDTKTGEIVEGEFTEVKEKPAPEPTHWCEEHNCAFGKKKKFGKDFWSHPIPGGGWCNESDQEKKKATASKAAAPKTAPYIPESVGDLPSDEPEPEPEGPQQLKRDPETIRTLNELYKACNEDFGMNSSTEVIAELGVSSQSDIADTPALCYRRIAAVR